MRLVRIEIASFFTNTCPSIPFLSMISSWFGNFGIVVGLDLPISVGRGLVAELAHCSLFLYFTPTSILPNVRSEHEMNSCRLQFLVETQH